MMRFVGAILLGCLALAVVGAGYTGAAEEQSAVPVIEIENPTYDFKEVPQGETVTHDFRVFNRGSAPLEIKSVRPG